MSHAADMAILERATDQQKLLEEIRDLLKLLVEDRENRILAEADAIRARHGARRTMNNDVPANGGSEYKAAMSGHVEIDYTNYRGERGKRIIEPRSIYLGTLQYHRDRQWLLIALDVAKGQERHFAMRDIHAWRDVR